MISVITVTSIIIASRSSGESKTVPECGAEYGAAVQAKSGKCWLELGDSSDGWTWATAQMQVPQEELQMFRLTEPPMPGSPSASGPSAPAELTS